MHRSLSSPRSTTSARSGCSTTTATAPSSGTATATVAYTRWILREHGITLAGPAPRSFMPPATKELMRGEAAASLPILLEDLATWVDIDTLACLLAPFKH